MGVDELRGDAALVLHEADELAPGDDRAGPSRSITASRMSFCRRPRWMENCGTSKPAATPRGSRQTV